MHVGYGKEKSIEGKTSDHSLRGMKGRNVSLEVKKGIRNSILLPALSYALETWTWNLAQQ